MLDNPPWSEDDLRETYFRDFKAVDEALLNHPGYKYGSALYLMNKGIQIFDRTTDELFEVIAAYGRALNIETVPTRKTKKMFDELDTSLRMRIVMASVAAMDLVEYSRRARNIISNIKDFDQKRAEAFLGNPPHEFIQGLRNFAVHYAVPAPKWVFRVTWHDDSREKEERMDIFLDNKTLLEYDGWNGASRNYLRENAHIKLGEVFAEYKNKALIFNNWFLSAFEEAAGNEFEDYRRSVRIVEKFRWRLRLNMAISRIGSVGKPFLEPFSEHLTEQEQEELRQYPDRSEVQILRLREILNIYEAFDDELYKKLLIQARE